MSQNLLIWVRINTQMPIISHSYVPYLEQIFHSQLNSKWLLPAHIVEQDQMSVTGLFAAPIDMVT